MSAGAVVVGATVIVEADEERVVEPAVELEMEVEGIYEGYVRQLLG